MFRPFSDIRTAKLTTTMALVLGLVLLTGCGAPPTVDSEQAISTVDALYMAITSKRAGLLDLTEKRLRDLFDQRQ